MGIYPWNSKSHSWEADWWCISWKAVNESCLTNLYVRWRKRACFWTVRHTFAYSFEMKCISDMLVSYVSIKAQLEGNTHSLHFVSDDLLLLGWFLTVNSLINNKVWDLSTCSKWMLVFRIRFSSLGVIESETHAVLVTSAPSYSASNSLGLLYYLTCGICSKSDACLCDVHPVIGSTVQVPVKIARVCVIFFPFLRNWNTVNGVVLSHVQILYTVLTCSNPDAFNTCHFHVP